MSQRKIVVTAAEGHTAFTIIELLLTDDDFSSKIDEVTALSLYPDDPRCKELTQMGAKVVPHKPGKMKAMVNTMKEIGADTICLIPPAHQDKYDITVELIEAAKKANVPNVLFLSSAGCDFAEKDKQPRLHEFLELETLVMAAKGDGSTDLGHSPCIIRAGFYAENLLLYSPQAKQEGSIPLPIGTNHLFPPVALGDVAQVAAHVLSGKGENGFDDIHRGQIMVVTGPMLATGDLLAQSASEAIGSDMKFEDISEAEAKKVLQAQSDGDQSELQYILEYYSLVREGKTNYIATTAFQFVTGNRPTEPSEFFQMYADSFKPEHANKRRKTNKTRNGGK